MPAVQLALTPPPSQPARTYWECRGPRDWQPVAVTCRYGPVRGLPAPLLPLVRTGRVPPRNVEITRADGSADVVPVRSLRRNRPA